MEKLKLNEITGFDVACVCGQEAVYLESKVMEDKVKTIILEENEPDVSIEE